MQTPPRAIRADTRVGTDQRATAPPPRAEAAEVPSPADGDATTNPFEIGRVVDQRYRIDARIGLGGSASCFGPMTSS
jgi:hypothetical protein